MEIILLVGGTGTRLQSVVSNVPKPMAPIGGKPFLEYLFLWIAKFKGVEKIILATGYMSEVIENYFGNTFNHIPIVYSKEITPLGTGGAVAKALKSCISEDVFIINGDSYFPVDINELKNASLKGVTKVCIALKEMTSFDRYGTVSIDCSNNILSFNEKKYCPKGLINGGIYYLQRSLFLTEKLVDKFSFEKEILEPESLKGSLKGILFDTPFIDIGIPEDYDKARNIVR